MSCFPRVRCTVLLVTLLSLARVAAADDKSGSLPVATSVKLLSVPTASTAQTAAAPMMVSPEPPPATLPAERLPQYQMGYQRSDFLSQAANEKGEIRFVLASSTVIEKVGRPLLIRMTVRIDGKAFTTTRGQKSKALLSSLEAPEKDDVEERIEPSDSNPHTGADEQRESIGVDAESDQQSVREVEDNSKSEDDVTVQPATEPAYQLTTDPKEMMRRYTAAIGENVSEVEASWLLAHWTDGPVLLLLHPYFQSFRANERPAYQVLDRDRDGTISTGELASAVESFQKCDANRDDIVDVLEIAKAAEAMRDENAISFASSPLLLLLADLEGIAQDDPAPHEPALFAVFKPFDTDQNGQIQRSEIETLARQSPDIDLIADFDTQKEAESKLTLVSVSPELQATIDTPTTIDGINVAMGETTLNFSAVQGSATAQVSLGAVVDGYPLLPLLDPNDDGRFTIRELRQLDQRLRQFDVDGDGQLTPQEAQSPIRVCIGLGAIVHRELASVRAIRQRVQAKTVSGPEWFARMDRNKDNDLARSEFPGTDQQFESLDADSDKLVSATEANEFDKQSNNAE